MKRLVFLLMTGCAVYHGPRGENDERDISGNYSLEWSNVVTARLDVGGIVYEGHIDGGLTDFGVIDGRSMTLDLSAFCERPEVKCPSEALWQAVSITQPKLATSNLEMQKMVMIDNTHHALDAGQRARSIGGYVNHLSHDRFLLGVGAAGAALGPCAALAISVVDGRMTRDGETVVTKTVCTTADGGVDAGCHPETTITALPTAKANGITNGAARIGFAAGCAFDGGVAGATLTLQTPFTGVRTGAYDPPPYEEPEVVEPDGGLNP